MCVFHLYRCKTSILQGGSSPSSYAAQRSYGRCGGWVHGRMNLYLHNIYNIVPPLGAYKSQLGGTYILSLLVYTVNVHCDLYIYIYSFVSSCRFCLFFARTLHSRSQIRMAFLYKCVCEKVICVTKSYVRKLYVTKLRVTKLWTRRTEAEPRRKRPPKVQIQKQEPHTQFGGEWDH